MENINHTPKTHGPRLLSECLERYKITLIKRMERSSGGISDARREWIMDLPTNRMAQQAMNAAEAK